MIATFDGQDYMVVFDKETSEFERLAAGQKLEAKLIDHLTGETFDKTFSVERADNDGSDGIKLEYFPSGQGWDDIKTFQVRVNERACLHIRQRGYFGTRYNGSDKIDFYTADPRDFITRP